MKEQIIPWFKEVNQKHKGYVPKDMEEWLDTFDKRHKSTRDLLGGYNKTIKLEMAGIEPPANIHEVTKIMTQVLQILPDYYRTYNFPVNHHAFQFPKLKAHRNIGGAKHIMGYVNRLPEKLAEDKAKKLSHLLSELGDLWKRTKEKPCELYATVSVDPKSFLLTGLFGVDAGSCFSQKSSLNPDKKFAFGTVPNSVMLAWHTEPGIEWKEQNPDIKARAMGVYLKDKQIFGAVNKYPLSSRRAYQGLDSIDYFDKTMTRGQMKVLAKDIFGIETPECGKNLLTLVGGINYGAYLSEVSYSTKKYPEGLKDRIVIPITNKYSKERHTVNSDDHYADWQIEEPKYED